MKTGIELIAEERKEQIEKHERTIEDDVEYNTQFQLAHAAANLCAPDFLNLVESADEVCPTDWTLSQWEAMMKKSYKDRLIIAGALVAAEIDRLQNS